MEVLAHSSAGHRNFFTGGERSNYWQQPHHHHQPLPHHSSPTSFSRYGPQPPPSPPYEMSKGNPANGHGATSAPYSLPPISDLLAFSRTEGRPADRHSQSSAGRSSPPRSHGRQLSSSSQHSPTSTNSSHRDMQPPLIMQPAHSIARIDPALFNDSRSRHPQTSPTSTRPSLDTSMQYPRSQPLPSPYPTSAPLRPHYSDISPRSAVSAGPYYNQAHYDTHPHTLPPPGPPTPRNMQPDSPMQSYQPSLPSRHVDEAASQAGRALLPLHPGASPNDLSSRTLPAVTPTTYHPYPQHTRDLSRGSVDSATGRSYAPSSPSSSRQGQPGSTSSASTLQDRYQCPTCSKAFSRPSSLRIHSHSHSGEKPYVCPRPSCGKAFSVRSNMKRHERGCHVGNGMPHEHAMDRRRELAPAEDE